MYAPSPTLIRRASGENPADGPAPAADQSRTQPRRALRHVDADSFPAVSAASACRTHRADLLDRFEGKP
jgi:hypothetical protein